VILDEYLAIRLMTMALRSTIDGRRYSSV